VPHLFWIGIALPKTDEGKRVLLSLMEQWVVPRYILNGAYIGEWPLHSSLSFIDKTDSVW
jgi:hypothetical protein